MKCCECGKARSNLRRQNPKGEDGIFKCTTCLGEAPEPPGEPMTALRQMERWVGGESVHNSERDECCPDFSCCQPELIWPVEKRKKFAEAFIDEDYEMTQSMSFEALGALVANEFPDENIHIVDGNNEI